MGGQDMVLSRTGWTGELGFEVYVARDTGDGPALWDHVVRAGTPYGLVASGLDSMDIRRIEAGILNYGSDIDASLNPFQAGLGAFVDLDKKDFIGKEALAQADHGLCIGGLKCPGGEPRIGGEVRQRHAVIGRVTAAAWSPYLDCGIGIVRLNETLELTGADLLVPTREGLDQAARLVALPFYDAERRIPRGLDRRTP